jgi:hypothetical protein
MCSTTPRAAIEALFQRLVQAHAPQQRHGLARRLGVADARDVHLTVAGH